MSIKVNEHFSSGHSSGYSLLSSPWFIVVIYIYSLLFDSKLRIKTPAENEIASYMVINAKAL